MLTHEAITDLQLIRTRAEFIRQNLLSSGQDELDQNEIVVQDIASLTDEVNLFADNYDLPVAMDAMFIKLIGTRKYRKEDLIYRVDKIIAVSDSVLGKQAGKNSGKKGGSNMKAIQKRQDEYPANQDMGFVQEIIQRHLNKKPEREFNLFSRRVTNTFIKMKVYNNCTFHISGREEDD